MGCGRYGEEKRGSHDEGRGGQLATAGERERCEEGGREDGGSWGFNGITGNTQLKFN